ncbi:MAG: hypothetical protein IJ410_00330 [Oscillospiraceae bacterium]|nr:hypothetical protein [Oscillospiraceae bacterium]
MKGLQHNVIEIKDTQNEGIDRILVFLKPGQNKIDVESTGREARDILSKVKVRRKMPRWLSDKRFIFSVLGFSFFLIVLALIFA